jgi:hypothetical protein
MADPKEIEYINKQLVDNYGVDTVTGRPMFRVVWADDQLEKRLVNTLDTGIELLFPEVREVKKYPYMKGMYTLERLVLVPEVNERDLPTQKLSYEPIWAFCNQNRDAVAPTWPASKFIVDTVYAAMGKSSLFKYKDDEKNTTEEGRQQRISELQDELFGDESGLMGKTHKGVGEGIVVPSTYESTQKENE